MQNESYAVIHVPSYEVIAAEVDHASALGYTVEHNKDPGPEVAVLLKAKHLRRWLKAVKEQDPRLPSPGRPRRAAHNTACSLGPA